MRLRNLLFDPPFIMYYLSFTLPSARELLERHGLMPGRTVQVERRDELAETLEVRPESGVRIRLGFRAASTILTTPVRARETESAGD